METNAETCTELAERLRRWIVIGGYVLGGWAIVQLVLIFATRERPAPVVCGAAITADWLDLQS